MTVSLEDVKYVVSRACGPSVEVVSYRMEPFSEQKDGFLGSHYLLSVDIQDGHNKNIIKTHTFFAKTRPDDPNILDTIMDENMYLEEMHFYNELRPKMIESYNCIKWSPECFLANKNIFIFEDLREQGYTMRPTLTLDEESLKSAISTLARFHASSLLTEVKLNKTFDEMYPNAFGEKLFTDVNKYSYCSVVDFDVITLIAEKYGWDTSLLVKIREKISSLVRPIKGKPNVICHCDLYKNNIMFDNSKPPKSIFVDYQLIRYASPTIDLSILFHLNTTPEYRKKFELDMFNYYYSILSNIFLKSSNKNKLPSSEDLLKNYKEHRIVGMFYASSYMPGLCLKVEEINKIMNDPNWLNFWLYDKCKRYGMIEKNLNEDPDYEQKIKDIVAEFLDEGKRICRL